MDSEQLFSASRKILQSLQNCELVSALTIPDNNQRVPAASARYMDFASGFSKSEKAVARAARLDVLQSPSYWFDLDTGTDEERRARQHACLKTIAQGQSFLLRLSGLVENHADPLDMGDHVSDIKMRLVDASDRASDPDRISRLIDGVDLIYRACAMLAQAPEDGLRVMRIGGLRGRTIVFNGDVEPATATRRIIRAANDIATNSIHGDSYSLDEVADSNPFMQSLDDLYRIGALTGDDAESIRQGVLRGTIMVLECGGRLYGVDATGDPLDFREVIRNGAPGSAYTQQGTGEVVGESAVDGEHHPEDLNYLSLDRSIERC